jgi:tetratricopeptide (TPR) repeat protein
MPGVFICYRHDDSAPYAGRLYDHLIDRFGASRVFMDTDTIKPGDDFVDVIEERVAACDVLICLIGRRWVEAKDKDGNRRLENPKDFVRLEIESALKRRVRVIPALVDGAQMPEAAQLPQSMSPLSRRNAFEITNSAFRQNVAYLVRVLEQSVGASAAPKPKDPEPGAEASPPVAQPAAFPPLPSLPPPPPRYDHYALPHPVRWGMRPQVWQPLAVAGGILFAGLALWGIANWRSPRAEARVQEVSTTGDHLQDGRLMASLDLWDAAVAEFRMAISADPKDADAHAALGSALTQKGDGAGAIAEFKSAIKLNPDAPDAYTGYKQAVALMPNDTGALSDLADTLENRGKAAEAEQEWRKLIALAPDGYMAHYHLAWNLNDQQRYADAIGEAETSIRLKKDYAPAHTELAYALKELNRLDEAVTEYRAALSLNSKDAVAHYNLGQIWNTKQDLLAAIAEFRKAVDITPDYVSALGALGWDLDRESKYDEAMRVLRKSLSVKPDDYYALGSLGYALNGKLRYAEAVDTLREAVRLKSDYAFGHFYLATALEKTGAKDEATKEYAEAHRLDPSFTR